MKDVSDILAKRLKMLEKPFSRDWISDFSFFTEFVQTNPLTSQVISSFAEKKETSHAPLIQNLEGLFKDGRKCLQEILQTIDKQDVSDTFQKKIQDLQKTKVDRKRISDPFFKLESTYYDYIAGFIEILEQLSQSMPNMFIIDHFAVKLIEAKQHNIILSLSPFVKECKHDIEILSGLRTSSICGKWDLLLQWAEWTKNGISPGNQPFEHNLSRLFLSLKISEATQSCGLFLLEQLASMKTVIADREICLKALELHLDLQEQYWIIAHISDGETINRTPYFIKKLQQGSQSYMLVKQLVYSGTYTESPTLSHTLGELEIKKELKKVFFPQDQFAGSLVQLNEIAHPINATEIVDHLSAIKQAKEHYPSFDWSYYYNPQKKKSS